MLPFCFSQRLPPRLSSSAVKSDPQLSCTLAVRPSLTKAIPMPPVLAKLTSHIPPRQFLRYLLVGLWNTAFGYAAYAALTAALTPRFPHAYIVASLLSSLLSITVAFLGYK